MNEDRYSVERRGTKFVVIHEDEPGTGPLFPPGDGKSGYERARAYAKACEEELRERRSKRSSS